METFCFIIKDRGGNLNLVVKLGSEQRDEFLTQGSQNIEIIKGPEEIPTIQDAKNALEELLNPLI